MRTKKIMNLKAVKHKIGFLFVVLLQIAISYAIVFFNNIYVYADEERGTVFNLKGRFEYKEGDMSIKNGIPLIQEDEEWKNLNEIKESFKDNIVWYRVKVPDCELIDPTILFCSYDQKVEIYADGNLIAKTYNGDFFKKELLGIRAHYIKIPETCRNKYLYFRMNSRYKSVSAYTLRFTRMVLSSGSQGIRYLYTASFSMLAVSGIFIFIAVVLFLSILFIGFESKLIFWYAILSICSGIITSVNSYFAVEKFNFPILWYYNIIFLALTAYSLLSLSPNVLITENEIKREKIIDFSKYSNMFVAVMLIMFDLFGIESIGKTFNFYILFFALSIAIVAIRLSKNKDKLDKKDRDFVITAITFCAPCGVHDILLENGIIDFGIGYIYGYGLLFVFLAIILVAIRKYIYSHKKLIEKSDEILKKNSDLNDAYMELKKAKEEIESINTSLEQRINERTNELREANNELSDVNQELVNTIKVLKETQEQLIQSEKMVALGRLVAGVAHEINTPIGVSVAALSHIDSQTKKILDAYKSNKIKRVEIEEYFSVVTETVEVMMTNMKRAAELITSFKRVSVDMSSEEVCIFNMKECINNIVVSFRPKLKKTKISINIDCDDSIEILGYPGAISQIISNLLMNSLLHGFDNREEGKVQIAVEKNENKISIVYEDDGKGISKDIIEKIYDPFFTTKRNQGGTGLGLNIVFNIVDQLLKGKIKCESEEGKWTRFVIEFEEAKNIKE